MTDSSETRSRYDVLRARVEAAAEKVAGVVAGMPGADEQFPFVLELHDALERLAQALASDLPAEFDDGAMHGWMQDVANDVAAALAVVPETPFDTFDSDAFQVMATRLDERTTQRVYQIRGVAEGSADPILARQWHAAAERLLARVQLARAERDLASISFTASRVQQIAVDTQQAAGEVADVELATAYDAYMRVEAKAANNFRAGAIAALVVVISVSAFSALNQDAVSGTSEALQHLALAASFLALFGYLARESSHHRNTARWAAVMIVQLKTFKAYTADMSAHQREDLRAFFGRRVFSEVPGNAPEGDLSPGSVQAVADLVKALQTKP